MTSGKKNILVVSLSFAPNAKVGSRRFGYLSKIFQEKYFNCHILTVKTKYLLHHDPSVPHGGDVHRTGMFPPVTLPVKKGGFLENKLRRLWTRLSCLSDPYGGWILPALARGLRIIKQHRIRAIVVTGPPFSPMITGSLLSILTGVPLVLDYRDPWTTNPRDTRTPTRRHRFNRFIERRVVRRASTIVFCSEIMKREFLDIFHGDASGPARVVTNAFDPANGTTPLNLGNGARIMLYAGSFYGERQLDLITAPLKNLMRRHKVSGDDFRVYILGRLSETHRNTIRREGLSELICEHPPVDYRTALRYMKGADYLFLPSGGDVKYAIPFKFFDYLSVRKPMLVVAPPDSAIRELSQRTASGYFADINDPAAVERALGNLIAGTTPPAFTGLDSYTWSAIARRYGDLLSELISGTPPPNNQNA